MHWILPAVGMGIFGFGLGGFCDTTLTFVIDSYRDVTARPHFCVSFSGTNTNNRLLESLLSVFRSFATFSASGWHKPAGLGKLRWEFKTSILSWRASHLLCVSPLFRWQCMVNIFEQSLPVGTTSYLNGSFKVDQPELCK